MTKGANLRLTRRLLLDQMTKSLFFISIPGTSLASSSNSESCVYAFEMVFPKPMTESEFCKKQSRMMDNQGVNKVTEQFKKDGRILKTHFKLTSTGSIWVAEFKSATDKKKWKLAVDRFTKSRNFERKEDGIKLLVHHQIPLYYHFM